MGLILSAFSGAQYAPLFYRSLENDKTDALKCNGWDLEASTLFVNVYILTVASTGISKPPCISGDRRKCASFTVTKTSALLEIRNLEKRLISRGE